MSALMRKFKHGYSLALPVLSESKEHASADELIAALRVQLCELLTRPDDEVMDAFVLTHRNLRE